MKAVRGVGLVVLAMLAAACSDGATGPADGGDLEAAMTSVETISMMSATQLNAGTIGSLHQLFRAAVRQVAQADGRDAAHALVEPIRQAALAARELRQAGDVEGFRAAMADVHAAQAQVVVDVLGAGPVEQALDAAEAHLAAHQTRIDAAAAAGRDTSRMQERLDAVASELAAARAAYESGDLAGALLRALFFGPRGHGHGRG